MSALRDRVAVLIVRDGRLLLFYRFRDGRQYYAVPGGKVEPGESLEQAAVREIKEETNLDVALGPLLLELESQGRSEHFFLAEQARGEVQFGGPELHKQSPQNFYRLEWVPLADVGKINLLPRALRDRIAASTELFRQPRS